MTHRKNHRSIRKLSLFEKINSAIYTFVFIGVIFFFAILIGQSRSISVAISPPVSENSSYSEMEITPIPVSPRPTSTPIDPRSVLSEYSGNDVFSLLNQQRVLNGVNPYISSDELCAVADYRLEQLLDLGKLDDSDGFLNLSESESVLSDNLNKFSTTVEIAAVGAKDAETVVNIWMANSDTESFLTGGEYVWACVRSEHSFSVALASF